MYRQALNMFAACAAVAVTTSATLPLCAADGGGLILDIEAPAGRWEDGIPLGNGGAGALLWGGGDTLNVTLDRADFWHNVAPASYLAPDFTWILWGQTLLLGSCGDRPCCCNENFQ